jgi:hypothetical protein
MALNMAMEIGYYPRDLFVLITKQRINSFGTKWLKQEHARKHNSFFWVFEKNHKKSQGNSILFDSSY